MLLPVLKQKNLDTHHGNYSIVFEKNNETDTENAYNDLDIVHCNWLPESAYKTSIPPVVNEQYIQFINASGKFNLLPQNARRKRLCYCSNNSLYDCYKEVLDPIYPGQTIAIPLISFLRASGLEPYITESVDVDTSLPMACVVTNSSEIKQLIIYKKCTKLKYSIAFLSDSWCELYLRTSYRSKFHIVYKPFGYFCILP